MAFTSRRSAEEYVNRANEIKAAPPWYSESLPSFRLAGEIELFEDGPELNWADGQRMLWHARDYLDDLCGKEPGVTEDALSFSAAAQTLHSLLKIKI